MNTLLHHKSVRISDCQPYPTYNRTILNIVLLIISVIFIYFFSVAGSPLYNSYGGDCNIFNIIGIGITQGKLPYTDLFDHKGPLLFYLYALAHMISPGKIGLFIIQILALYFSLHYIFKTSYLYLKDIKSSAIVVFVGLVFIAITMEEGGQVESFELPFIALSLYKAIKFYKTGDLKSIKSLSLILGICFGAIFLLRINDAFIQTGIIYFFLFVHMMSKRLYRLSYMSAMYFILGFGVTLCPFVVYFLVKGNLQDVWFGMFTFNYIYANLTWLHDYTFKALIMSLMTLLALMTIKHRLECFLVILPTTIASVVFIGNSASMHYYLILTPVLCLIIALIYNTKLICILLWILIIGGWNIANSNFPFWGSLIYKVHQNYEVLKDADSQDTLHADMQSVLSKIPEAERNEIWNYNLQHTKSMDIFTHFNITPKNRFFVPQHLIFDKSLLKYESVEKDMPKWILVNKDQVPEEVRPIFDQNYIIITSYADGQSTINLLMRR